MRDIKKQKTRLLFVVAGGLCLIHVLLALEPIRVFSPTYDEPVHLTAGAIYLKTGDFRFAGFHHPPFAEMWAALPLLVLPSSLPINDAAWVRQEWNALDQYTFADRFLYHNHVSADTLLTAGRLMQLLLSLLMGGFLFWFVRKSAGGKAALYALVFWCFSPIILANGTVVTTDFAFALFFSAFFMLCSVLGESFLIAALAGISLGLCLASKHMSVAILPSVLALLLWRGLRRVRHGERFLAEPFLMERKKQISFLCLVSVAFLTLWFVYGFGNLSIYWEGLKEAMFRNQRGRGSFFFGDHRVTGWLGYFPAVFLIKTPIPLLIGLGISLAMFIKKKIVLSPFLCIPPLVFFCLACASTVQIGHRHILAVYPFLFVAAAVGLSKLSNRFIWVGGLLIGWSIVACVSVKPHYIAYFNEAVGGPRNGVRYLTDSNLDWGQGLKLLKQALEPSDIEKGIYLCYFGVGDPHAYGIRYMDLGPIPIGGREDDRADPRFQPTKFAISATHLQSTYYTRKDVYAWLKDYKPWKVIGYSIFVYDFSDHPEILKRWAPARSPSGKAGGS